MKRIAGLRPDWGIALVRLMTGLLFAVHGYQKFAGGIGGVATLFAKLHSAGRGRDGAACSSTPRGGTMGDRIA